MTACAVEQIDPETGDVVMTYSSTQQAARVMKCSSNIISHVLLGKQQTAAGYFWRRLDPQPPCSELCYDIMEHLEVSDEPVSKAEIRFMFSLSKGSEQNVVDTLLGLGFITAGWKGAVKITALGLQALKGKPY